MSREKLITFNAEPEHFYSQEGFMTLVKRIQHFQLDQYGVVIIKCPQSVTIEHKKKMIPLLEKIHLNEYQRQKNKFVVEDGFTLCQELKRKQKKILNMSRRGMIGNNGLGNMAINT